ncbi:SPOSA6832_02403 [Sporobolomyces salmonicolor]|uniref:SPOSA6832_02403-mRNA-1:cds n=1 Tax=Sporidiobolus salmonicolor TaxID=5005 RepID=A0A0D6ELB0_SPOSA|nr:SPOSA6832_02403 [Sporobolomyces salmonicolor]
MGATPDTASRRHAASSKGHEGEHGRARPDAFATYEPKRIPRKNPDYGSSSQELGYDPNDRTFTNDLERPRYPTQTFYQRCWLEGFQLASAIGTSLTFNLIVVLAVISHVFKRVNPFHKDPPRPAVEKEYEDRISGERYSARAKYYAEFFGYECEDIDVETEDGFVLRVHHLISKKHEKPGHPVILQHGILSNSVTYMVNEERSLAFWLLEQGYDVYLGNIRTNFKMPHRHVKDIGLYDVPAIVEYVNKRTGLKPAYIGHSQGASTMFIALSRGMRPDIGNKISTFIALAPAVYAGPALRHFPFSLMRRFKSRRAWKLVFGVREFIPIISVLQAVLPSWLFGHIANVVFAFIFGFHDHNYMGVFSYANCVFDTTATEPWFPPSFPPLALFYGTLDTLVLGKPLVERIRSHEPHVRMLKAVALENYDPLWAYTAAEECYPGIREMIEETRYL